VTFPLIAISALWRSGIKRLLFRTEIFCFQWLTAESQAKKPLFLFISITYAELKAGKIMSFVEFQSVKLWLMAIEQQRSTAGGGRISTTAPTHVGQ
jgi:hypothetical protein